MNYSPLLWFAETQENKCKGVSGCVALSKIEFYLTLSREAWYDNMEWLYRILGSVALLILLTQCIFFL